MILKLQEYDYELIYMLGKTHYVADVLSRTPIARKQDLNQVVASVVGEEYEEGWGMTGQKMARWIVGRIDGDSQELPSIEVHQRQRKSAKANVEGWADRKYGWLGN